MTEPVFERRIRLADALPFATIHLLCIGVLWVGWSWVAVLVALLCAAVRMFVITAFYHRYFSHRAFRVHRATQTIAAALGTTTAQRGPLWWAGHHRHHHRRSDRPDDLHSPVQHGFWWSHCGWFLSPKGITNPSAMTDFAKYPELQWIDRWHLLGPPLLGAAMFALGATLATVAPDLGTSGAQMFVWGFAVSTTALYHATFTINSLAHVWGRRPFETADTSRNNLWLALLTLGEGWHNNHHHYPASARQGFRWWEIDVAYAVLCVMRWLGLAWDLRPVPAHILDGRPASDAVPAAAQTGEQSQ
ncbi:MAG: acyl-CoA desaturase [Planctomycetota bacterium]